MPNPLSVYLNRRNVAFGIFRLYKAIYQKRYPRQADQTQILLILGCQRSGTSLMYWIFERDLNTKIYRESSPLSSNDQPKKLRLNPLPDVNAALGRHKLPLVVLKPLVESQRALQLLEGLPGARVLWMYRHYKDVAMSNLKAFGIHNGIDDLRPIVENRAHNWRSENVSEDTRRIVCQYFSQDMRPLDAAALFWLARNRLFFELNLHQNRKVMLCRYEDLSQSPADVVRRIYQFVGCPYPGDHIIKDVHAQSVGKGSTAELSPDIETLCAGLLAELDGVTRREM